MVDRDFRAPDPIAALCADKEPRALYRVEYLDDDGDKGAFCCKGFHGQPIVTQEGRVCFMRVKPNGESFYFGDRTFDLDPSCITKVERFGKNCFSKGPAYSEEAGTIPECHYVFDLKNAQGTNLFDHLARFQEIEVAHRLNRDARAQPLYCTGLFLGFGPVVDENGKKTEADYVIILVKRAATSVAPAAWEVALVPWESVLQVRGFDGESATAASALYERVPPSP